MKAKHFTSAQEVKFKIADFDNMEFSGYGAVFNNVDQGGDLIAPGAFTETLAEAQKTGDWPAMLSQHGGMLSDSQGLTPIGLWTEMSEDAYGLKVTGRLADTERGREMYTLMKMEPRPAIRGMSIGYRVKGYELGSEDDAFERKLTKLSLGEISLATFPMNESAVVNQVKSIDDLNTLAELEAFLRDAGGLSRTEAKHFIAKIKDGNRRDAELSELANSIQSLTEKLRG